MEWVISLAAVAVSMVTVIVNYFMNKDNLKYNTKENRRGRIDDFRVDVWKDILGITDKLVNITNEEHIESLFNSAIVAKNEGAPDKEELRSIDEFCEELKSLQFLVSVNIKTIDENCGEYIETLNGFVSTVISIAHKIENYYVSKTAGRDEYSEIAQGCVKLGKDSDEFKNKTQDYLATLQEKLFIERK